MVDADHRSLLRAQIPDAEIKPTSFPGGLAVIYLTYNQQGLIERSLGRLLVQQDFVDQWIAVDDASHDESFDQVSSKLSGISNVALLRHQQNQGAIAGINEALALVNQRWVYIAAADDYVLPEFLTKMWELCRIAPNAGILSCLSWQEDDQGQNLGVFPSPVPCVQPASLSAAQCAEFLWSDGSWFMGNGAIFRADILQQMGGFEPHLAGFADCFAAWVLALRHGAGFLPEAQVVKVDVVHGMGHSIHRSPDQAEKIWTWAENRMRANYRELFPEPLIRRLRDRWQFLALRQKWEDRLGDWPEPLRRLGFVLARVALLLAIKPFDFLVPLRLRLAYRKLSTLSPK